MSKKIKQLRIIIRSRKLCHDKKKMKPNKHSSSYNIVLDIISENEDFEPKFVEEC